MPSIANSPAELQQLLEGTISYEEGNVKIEDENKLRDSVIDDLIYTAVFSENEETKEEAKKIIRDVANELGAVASSINDLYRAMARGETRDFTTPAINIRGMTYDVARQIFKVALKHDVGAFIFEIAKSEIGYTFQRPSEYTSAVLAAAIKEGYKGPVFIQGDHFQFNAKNYEKDPEAELNAIKDLTEEAIKAGFYNIDIDPSTLVDYSKSTLKEQQYHNYLNTAKMTKFIREIEPEGITVSIGGEIGHIGGKNSTVEEFEAFMEGYLENIPENMEGISKISVQTGTAHGGIPLPDGTVAKVKLDFNVLRDIGKVAREKYNLGGTVQHGASTLPDELFHKFPNNNCCEIHLATGFQNIMYDLIPEDFRNKIYNWIKENLKNEWKEGWTEEQFIYKTRKKGFGPFKYEWWTLDKEYKDKILEALYNKFEFLFDQLAVFNTKEYTDKYIKLVKLPYQK
ncbi:class II fructose-bisphosphate aldolase [Hydrogenothermus marinus]|uniref:Fructose/tagatose bisphosphate aldolase n=1 Tax=Hydrogenothermus marinus TaxID=133270 RepID=A0A3M0BRG9_9AQUI|nr:class II fructose-bisphosphate aldolase [Hydrogenothermus marinus]RMA97095.1 fructose/tagatose bisphosphate aldolase [Hydrogenothermus marinus]